MWCTCRVVGCFSFCFFAKNVRKRDENVHRVKKVIHLSRPNSTRWRIVVKSHKWNTQFSRINSHREDRTTFSNFHYLTRIFWGTRKKGVCVCSIYTPNRNFLVKETGPLLLSNQCLSFKVQYCCFSKIQLVVYYQCRVLIVWATARLYVIAHS